MCCWAGICLTSNRGRCRDEAESARSSTYSPVMALKLASHPEILVRTGLRRRGRVGSVGERGLWRARMRTDYDLNPSRINSTIRMIPVSPWSRREKQAETEESKERGREGDAKPSQL